MKADTREAGADVQQSGLFRCRPSGRWGTFPSPGENGVSCLKDHLPISVEAEVFIRWGGEQNKELKRGACKVLFVRMRQETVWCALSCFSHPGFTVEGQQISQSWDA